MAASSAAPPPPPPPPAATAGLLARLSTWARTRTKFFWFGAAMVGASMGSAAYQRRRPAILTLRLEGQPADSNDVWRAMLLPVLGQRYMSVVDMVRMLDRARNDPRVLGLVCHIASDFEPTLAQAQELSAAITRFTSPQDVSSAPPVAEKQKKIDAVRELMAKLPMPTERPPAGLFDLSDFDAPPRKLALCFADNLGIGNPLPLGVASAFDAVVLPSSGIVGFAGNAAEVPFLAKSLDMAGVKFQRLRLKDWKTALDTLADEKPSAAFVEQTQRLRRDSRDQLLDLVAENRGLSKSELERFYQEGPFLAGEARERGLVDLVEPLSFFSGMSQFVLRSNFLRTAWRDTPWLLLASPVLMPAHEYLGWSAEVFPRQATAGKVAVVTANGNIKPSGEDGIVPTRTVPQLRALANDPTVRAVVVRVNSGGGDVGSSEALGDAVAKLRSAGKKVVASMGSVAASGGYMFACPAHKLFAQGGTLTGSIGVLAGKPAAGVLAERLGVHVHSFADHPAASLTSFTRPWEGRALDFMLRYSHNSYRFFVDFVARHRERDVEAVERVAGGQVWTGRQAKELGLVDELGGLHEAVEEAKRLAGGGDLAVVYDARRGGRDFGAIAGTPFALASAALSSLFAPRLLAQRESSVAEAFESLARRPVLEEAVWGFLRRGLGREVTQLERDAASARVELRVQPELSEGVRRL